MSKASDDVLAERQRQLDVEGWSPEHDDKYWRGELVRAASCYMRKSSVDWPWHYDWWKPADPRRNLVKACALILAEIERLDRKGM